jgi:hypothetical protein
VKIKFVDMMIVLRREFGVRSEYLTKKPLEGFASSKMGGEVGLTGNMKCADDRVLLAKEETALQCVIDRLIEVGKCYGM